VQSTFPQVKTTSPKKYCVRPNTGIVQPHSSADVTGKNQVPDHIVLEIGFCKQRMAAGFWIHSAERCDSV
jgi:hypothetical protein